MSYAKLGFSCRPQTVALTNNHKFFTLDNPLYNVASCIKQVRNISCGNMIDNIHHSDPSDLKAYNLDETPKMNKQVPTGGCMTCNKY